MDTIDVIIARALTPEQSILDYEAIAQQAATEASSAVSDAATALSSAEDALSAATSAAEELNSILSDISSATQSKIDDLNLSHSLTDETTYYLLSLLLNQDETNLSTIEELLKLYKATGANNDGTMTQAAITQALNNLSTELTSAITSVETELHNEIQNIPSGGGSGGGSLPNFPEGSEGLLLAVNENRQIATTSIDVNELFISLLSTGNFCPPDSAGIEIDYENKSFKQIIDSSRGMPTPFKRVRCNVSDSGEILSWAEGDTIEDGSVGQIMVYQPKFYYCRIPLKMENNKIRKEIYFVSGQKHPGFDTFPAFKRSTEEVDYILLSAYEGCAQYQDGSYEQNDSGNYPNTAKLSSIAGVKPISGANDAFTIIKAQSMAQLRGSGWDISSFAAETINQLLMLIEMGEFNGQHAIGRGIVDFTNGSGNRASLTGSTSGIYTGRAESTINGNTSYSENGKTAIVYRGVENPWGNIWKMVRDISVIGTGTNGGYIVTQRKDSSQVGFEDIILPNQYGWVSAFGKTLSPSFSNNDNWFFIPVECSGNSSLPIGDNLFTKSNLFGQNKVMIGGAWYHKDNAGPFYLAFDRDYNDHYGESYSARLMFVPPQKNSIYESNIIKWENKTAK